MANERQAPQSDIKQLISKGLEQGYLTYAEVNDHLPDDVGVGQVTLFQALADQLLDVGLGGLAFGCHVGAPP